MPSILSGISDLVQLLKRNNFNSTFTCCRCFFNTCFKLFTVPYFSVRLSRWITLLYCQLSRLLIFCRKKAKFSGIFGGKFSEKSADFAGFSWEESQNSLKNQPISGIFVGKKSKFAEKSGDFGGFSRKKVKFRRIFRGKFLEKSADFTGNFVGKLRHETISKKQLISLDFGGEISLKSINFASM